MASTTATRYGDTPLHAAARAPGGYAARVIGVLLRTGPDPDVRGPDRRTPLHVAASRGSVAALQALLDAGADPNARDKDGWSPLHLAAALSGEAHVQRLLDAGADPSARDRDGNTPADLASFSGSPELATLLGRHAASRDGEGPAP